MGYIKNQFKFLELNFIKYQTFLVCSLPLLMITGPAIPDVIVTIISISFLVFETTAIEIKMAEKVLKVKEHTLNKSSLTNT
jgi:hypothetical protein